MICPHCQANESVVLDTYHTKTGTRRRRKCTACTERFTTYEMGAEEYHAVKQYRLYVEKLKTIRTEMTKMLWEIEHLITKEP